MGRVGGLYRPIGAYIEKGGRYTRFVLPEYHFVQNVGNVSDGQTMVTVKGEYHWKLGDFIKIISISGWRLYKSNAGKQYFTIKAEIEYIEKESVEDRDETTQKYLKDIAEELL